MKPIEPMEALLANEVPGRNGWQYEPKWDGFRCIATRDGALVELWSVIRCLRDEGNGR